MRYGAFVKQDCHMRWNMGGLHYAENQNRNPWNGCIQHHQRMWSSSGRCQLGKIMFTVFWDRKEVLLVDFLPCDNFINSVTYCETLTKMLRAIQNKRRSIFSDTLCYNNRLHTANQHKISSHNLAGTNLILLHAAQISTHISAFESISEVSTAMMTESQHGGVPVAAKAGGRHLWQWNSKACFSIW